MTLARNNKGNPLEALLATSEADKVDPELLRQLLIEYIRIHPETKNIEFKPAVFELSNEPRVLIYLLAAYARRQLFSDFDDKIAPKEIREARLMPSGSERVTLKSLEAKRLIKNEGGHYFIPPWNIPVIRNYLKEVIS